MKNFNKIFSTVPLFALIIFVGAGCNQQKVDQQIMQDQQRKINMLTKKIDELSQQSDSTTTTPTLTPTIAPSVIPSSIQPSVVPPKVFYQKVYIPQQIEAPPTLQKAEDPSIKIERCRAYSKSITPPTEQWVDDFNNKMRDYNLRNPGADTRDLFVSDLEWHLKDFQNRLYLNCIST